MSNVNSLIRACAAEMSANSIALMSKYPAEAFTHHYGAGHGRFGKCREEIFSRYDRVMPSRHNIPGWQCGKARNMFVSGECRRI